MRSWRLALLAIALASGCSTSQGASRIAPAQPSPTQPLQVQPLQAIDEAAAYLLRHLDRSGRFDYLRRSSARESKYNVLRHAGTIYALAQYHQHKPSAASKAAILRASVYLKRDYLRAPQGKPEMLAIFSKHEEEGGQPGTAKLGGAGLALLALGSAHRLDPSVVSKDELRALGRFVAFMQRADGSFHSKYVDGRGFDESFHSLYYPGEAMLGLATLYDIDGDTGWLDVALRSAAHLVTSRQDSSDWPADHWMMLASAPLLQRYASVPAPAITADALQQHIAELGAQIVATQILHPPPERSREAGTFSKRANGTPTATRLEGLTALLHNQRVAGAAEDARLRRSIRAGLAFLQGCQILDDSAERGGMPHSCAADAGESKRDREVRIDYVQHYLSAMLAAHALGLFSDATNSAADRSDR